MSRKIDEALIQSDPLEIGYVCRHGHFQFIDDPDGDACGTKNVGRIYVQAEPEITPEELAEAVTYALESHHRKMEEWRANAV